MTAALLLFASLGLTFGFLAVLVMLSMLGRVNRAERGEARQAETVMRQAVRIARLERAAIDRELALAHTRQDLEIAEQKERP